MRPVGQPSPAAHPQTSTDARQLNTVMAILRDFFSIFFSRVALILIIFLGDIFISRSLGPQYKGYYVVLYLTPSILSNFAGLGLDMGLNSICRLEQLSSYKLFRLFSSSVLICALFSALLIFVLDLNVKGFTAWLYSGLEDKADFWLIYSFALIPAEILFNLATMLVLTSSRPFLYGVVRLIHRGPIMFASIWIFFFETTPVWAIKFLLLSQIGAAVFGGLLGALVVGYRFQKPSFKVGPLLAFSFKALPARFIEKLQTRITLLFLGMLASAYAVGIFSVALSISEALLIVSGEMALVFFSRNVLNEAGTYLNGVRVLTSLNIILGVGIASVASLLLPVLYGERFSGSIPLIWLLLPGAVGTATIYLLSPFFIQGGRSLQLSCAWMIGLAINIVGNIIFIPMWGSHGAAWASSLSCLIIALILFQRYKSIYNYRWSKIIFLQPEDIQFMMKLVGDFGRKILPMKAK